MDLPKIFLGLSLGAMMLLLATGCGKGSVPAVEPSPEKTPWLFPEPQIELLGSDEYRVRGLAVKNLAKMGAKAEIAIPALEKLLEDKEPNVRALAEEAIKKIREDLGSPGS